MRVLSTLPAGVNFTHSRSPIFREITDLILANPTGVVELTPDDLAGRDQATFRSILRKHLLGRGAILASRTRANGNLVCGIKSFVKE